MTLLRPAGRFSPVRVPLLIVEAAAGTTEPTEVDTYLAQALHGAPVIRCNNGQWVYVLVEPIAARDWDVPDAECLGEETNLGVPRPDLVGHLGRTVSYWAVPMARPGALGTKAVVSQLVDQGRRMAAGGDAMTDAQRTIDVTKMRAAYEAALACTSADEAVSMRNQLVEHVALLVPEVRAMKSDSKGDSLLEVVLRRANEVLAEEPAHSTAAGARQVHDLATSCRALLTLTLDPRLLTQASLDAVSTQGDLPHGSP
ncbi:DUF6415 family natural product biosynthesis protein [Streptomyces sp. NPDC004393]